MSEEFEQLIKVKDQAYAERNTILAAFAWLIQNKGCKFPCRVFLANHPDTDESWEDDWRNILVIQPYGDQMAWHIHDSEMPLFKGIHQNSGYVWDGHTTEQKYQLLIRYFCEVW